MCTVTFLPLADEGFVLTSNRDVGYQREKALYPKTFVEDGVSLQYPKDGKAGGTWIGTSRDNRLICLLNGGFENHKRKASYPKSRGLIVKELLIAESFKDNCLQIDLKNIEPFTLVVVDWKEKRKLYEFVWDGEQRFLKELDQSPHIWSSSTLFTSEMKNMRREWFAKWLEQDEKSPRSILEFHSEAGIGDPETDVVLKREKVGTVSITQVVKSNEQIEMSYFPRS
ncbi:NRDE family protein [Lutimonas vermicola]|uniref:NRDE family protein n=1 Tax=Lutimonas vermicola TaxID=414288 RepID=A0ABU9L198_9FLAO